MVLLAPAGTVLPLSGEWIFRAALSILPHRHFTRSFLEWLLEAWAAGDARSRERLNREIEFAYLAVRSFAPTQAVNPHVLTDAELATIGRDTPTLFLVGNHEKIYDADRAVARLRAVVPEIDARIVSGAGHDLTYVRADTVTTAILAFLRRE